MLSAGRDSVVPAHAARSGRASEARAREARIARVRRLRARAGRYGRERAPADRERYRRSEAGLVMLPRMYSPLKFASRPTYFGITHRILNGSFW